jgi:elongation factor P--(R)-beta-lysine ligase
MPNETQWASARARQKMNQALRQAFADMGYVEVETPCLVPVPGMEPYIEPFEAQFVPETGVGQRRPLFLHTSPEYAMKRLLADGSPPLFQLCKTFRNGEVSHTHNPEFSMLEFYRPHADYHGIMNDTEAALSAVETAVAPGRNLFSQRPYQRLTVRDAVRTFAGIELPDTDDGPELKRRADAAGIFTGTSTAFDDVFFQVLLDRVEPRLGRERPTFLVEYPASMAALARLKPNDSRVAERVELYCQGLELANGFSELTDEKVQRHRLLEEQAVRQRLGKRAVALDEKFLAALPRVPPSAGIAVGLDRVLMLLLGVTQIDDVLLFPASGFFA